MASVDTPFSIIKTEYAIARRSSNIFLRPITEMVMAMQELARPIRLS